jgi:hypothetical protein
MGHESSFAVHWSKQRINQDINFPGSTSVVVPNTSTLKEVNITVTVQEKLQANNQVE